MTTVSFEKLACEPSSLTFGDDSLVVRNLGDLLKLRREHGEIVRPSLKDILRNEPYPGSPAYPFTTKSLGGAGVASVMVVIVWVLTGVFMSVSKHLLPNVLPYGQNYAVLLWIGPVVSAPIIAVIVLVDYLGLRNGRRVKRKRRTSIGLLSIIITVVLWLGPMTLWTYLVNQELYQEFTIESPPLNVLKPSKNMVNINQILYKSMGTSVHTENNFRQQLYVAEYKCNMTIGICEIVGCIASSGTECHNFGDINIELIKKTAYQLGFACFDNPCTGSAVGLYHITDGIVTSIRNMGCLSEAVSLGVNDEYFWTKDEPLVSYRWNSRKELCDGLIWADELKTTMEALGVMAPSGVRIWYSILGYKCWVVTSQLLVLFISFLRLTPVFIRNELGLILVIVICLFVGFWMQLSVMMIPQYSALKAILAIFEICKAIIVLGFFAVTSAERGCLLARHIYFQAKRMDAQDNVDTMMKQLMAGSLSSAAFYSRIGQIRLSVQLLIDQNRGVGLVGLAEELSKASKMLENPKLLEYIFRIALQREAFKQTSKNRTTLSRSVSFGQQKPSLSNVRRRRTTSSHSATKLASHERKMILLYLNLESSVPEGAQLGIGTDFYFSTLKLPNSPLLITGINLLRHVIGTEDCYRIPIEWYRVFEKIERLYKPNPYHNGHHGAMVGHQFFVLLRRSMLSVGDIEETSAAVLAALAHDVAHPGRTNPFFERRSFIADMEPNGTLERYHAATLLMVLSREDTNPYSKLTPARILGIRKLMVSLIMYTNLTRHFDVVQQTMAITESEIRLPENRSLALGLLIKAADTSHGHVRWSDHLNWSLRISEEFYQEGDELMASGHTKALQDLYKRSLHSSNFAASQAGFLLYVLLPMYQELSRVIPEVSEIKDSLYANYEAWNQMKNDATPVPEIPKEYKAVRTQEYWPDVFGAMVDRNYQCYKALEEKFDTVATRTGGRQLAMISKMNQMPEAGEGCAEIIEGQDIAAFARLMRSAATINPSSSLSKNMSGQGKDITENRSKRRAAHESRKQERFSSALESVMKKSS